MGEDFLHGRGAAAFEEDEVAGGEKFTEMGGAGGVIGEVSNAGESSGASGVGDACGVRGADGEKAIEAEGGSELADLRVTGGGVGTEFTHGAEYSESAGGTGFGEGLQTGDHGVGVGVVGVVEEMNAGENFGFESSAGELSPVEGICDGFGSHAKGPGHGGSKGCVADHVATENWQGGLNTSASEIEGEGGARRGGDKVQGGDIATADACCDDFGLAETGDTAGVGIVGVENNVTCGGDVDG